MAALRFVSFLPRHCVHSGYEDMMVDRHVPEVIQGAKATVSSASKPPAGGTGRPWQFGLMQKTFAIVAPADIINEHAKSSGRNLRRTPVGCGGSLGQQRSM
jgi:hypothetical protein